MKNIKYLTILILSLSFYTVIISCSDENNVEKVSSNINFRENFITNKTFDIIKQDFQKLSIKDKHILWDNKINQLLSENLPEEHILLIKELKIEFEKNINKKENRLKSIFIQLAQITPEEDFIKMFFELTDYKFHGHFQKFIPSESFNIYLENCNYEYTDYQRVAPLPDCNCSYTCTIQTINPSICQTSKCNPTMDGCGPFGLSECDGRLYFC
jgi:hypothetical protein